MALQELTSAFIKRLRLSERPIGAACRRQCVQRRCFADAASQPETQSETSQPEIKDLEHLSFVKSSQPDKAIIESFDPVANAKKRGTQLPPSRYAMRTIQ
jgi:large subunit ribosomal protein L5